MHILPHRTVGLPGLALALVTVLACNVPSSQAQAPATDDQRAARLVQALGLREAETPISQSPQWRKPSRILIVGVPPDRLIFELTETAAVAHVGRATAFANRLSELGCGFALDDFGAGFGSFYYLKHLPFDYLKIDGEFVTHCTRNETDRTLIAAVVQIARGMRKQTIAEYANDRETVEVLTRLGVDYAQGFYLGRPAPLNEHLQTAAVTTVGRDHGARDRAGDR